ncbi:dTDP-4-dehydrorhamnose reductase [Sphingomonas turrisvirgatae]|uniref:dTDP-4-dehydrorhamnose reductase n=1 Tax=Sphingomonas turrisvirgatae TaxID=1888892 RepID=A0A1E3LRX3_9SPHN|nr:dTDP-4-dehydrorhamnose reductase [Sphingomonas turrisvirgatae]ODP36502.1 dTDP-4-dehydrorhamnose reductase [Sphingomonas turrisvirgatae]
MKALIVGSGGQLGRALAAVAPAGAQVIGHDRAALDIGDAAAVDAAVAAARPDLLFNAAAYTAVDKAESEEAEALRINGTAVAVLAGAARRHGAQLVHVSTDFVFDGRSGVPYAPDAPTAPLGAYGRTKLAGEQAAGADALIVRTAWVYGASGGNFVRTMLRLMRERDEVRVVADQIGTPTRVDGLAAALWALGGQGVRGTFQYTDSGVASWYDFAVAIQEEALAIGLLDRAVPVIPIPTTDFPTPARRPAFSVLDKQSSWDRLGWQAPHWRVALRTTLKELSEHG